MKTNQIDMDAAVREPVKGEQRFEQIYHKQFRHCDCAWPIITKTWNDAVGTFVAVRTCCVAKAVEELTGKKLYEVYDFPPKWEWDCEQTVTRKGPDGTTCEEKRGAPPEWVKKRMDKKGIPVRNHPDAE